jgi:hypothetical protein
MGASGGVQQVPDTAPGRRSVHDPGLWTRRDLVGAEAQVSGLRVFRRRADLLRAGAAVRLLGVDVPPTRSAHDQPLEGQTQRERSRAAEHLKSGHDVPEPSPDDGSERHAQDRMRGLRPPHVMDPGGGIQAARAGRHPIRGTASARLRRMRNGRMGAGLDLNPADARILRFVIHIGN